MNKELEKLVLELFSTRFSLSYSTTIEHLVWKVYHEFRKIKINSYYECKKNAESLGYVYIYNHTFIIHFTNDDEFYIKANRHLHYTWENYKVIDRKYKVNYHLDYCPREDMGTEGDLMCYYEFCADENDKEYTTYCGGFNK